MISAIVVAGGKGERMNSALPKQFLEILCKPILLWAVERIWACPKVTEMVVVVPEQHRLRAEEILSGREVKIVAGGLERQDSVYAGLRASSAKAELVLIHDGVRPFPSRHLIERVIAGAENFGAAIPGLPVKETIKEIEQKSGRVIGTVDRSRLYSIQTPQVFSRELIIEAHERAQNLGFYATDDAGLIEWMGGDVVMVSGEETNLKITTALDLRLAELIAKEMVG
jgi:2-C-methyl-D-erythritol 4-phosphate cytidylyltransferase